MVQCDRQVTKTKTRMQGSFLSFPPCLADLRHRDWLDIQISELSLEEALFRAVVSTGLIISCQSTLGTEPEWELGAEACKVEQHGSGGKKRAQ